MRLNERQIQFIRQQVRHHLGEKARVWLFGSRVDDGKRGGDVDLYVETDEENNLLSGFRCRIGLEEDLDLHVDLIIQRSHDDRPIGRIAKQRGIRLL